MAGELTPMVDRAYPLEHVPEVMHYLEAGHARGKVVIALADGG
jgi:NADPH:quinone reductase-like Zn-dependent oxidoreductase